MSSVQNNSELPGLNSSTDDFIRESEEIARELLKKTNTAINASNSIKNDDKTIITTSFEKMCGLVFSGCDRLRIHNSSGYDELSSLLCTKLDTITDSIQRIELKNNKTTAEASVNTDVQNGRCSPFIETECSTPYATVRNKFKPLKVSVMTEHQKEIKPAENKVQFNPIRMDKKGSANRFNNVPDYRPLIQCFKCLDFGHLSYDCEIEENRCKICAGPHEFQKCTVRDEKEYKCYNCSKFMRGNKKIYHKASSKKCPYYKQMQLMYKKIWSIYN